MQLGFNVCITKVTKERKSYMNTPNMLPEVRVALMFCLQISQTKQIPA